MADMTTALEPRAYFLDGVDVARQRRFDHGTLMTVAFCVLFPLGAIVMHLPIPRVVPFVHPPIQAIALILAIAGMALGIEMASRDFNLFATNPAHIVIGLIVVCWLIAVQPLGGLLQHLYYKKHQKTSILGYVHRWAGRIAVILGWINIGLGFQLVGFSRVSSTTVTRTFALMGVFGGIYILLFVVDGILWMLKKPLLSQMGRSGPRQHHKASMSQVS